MDIADILRSHPVSIPLSEADTRARLIDRIMYRRGWTEECIKREETLGGIDIINDKGHRRSSGRADYVLRIKVNPQTQPVALAVIEAKKNSDPPAHGLSQTKGYAACKRMNVPFVFSSNGYQFVMFDRSCGLTAPPPLHPKEPERSAVIFP